MRHEPYAADVTRLARENTDFRRVLHTTDRSQVVLMSVPAGQEIGEETHDDIDQMLVFVVVPAGTRHNFVTKGQAALKLFTVYAPPEHPSGTVHGTKAEADAAERH